MNLFGGSIILIKFLSYNFYISVFITLTILVFVKDKVTWKKGGVTASFLLIILVFISCFIVLPLPSIIAIITIYILNYALPGFFECNKITDLFEPIYLAFMVLLLPLTLLNMAIKSLNISKLNKIFIELLLFVLITSLVLNGTLYYFSDIRITSIKLLELSLIIGLVFFMIDEVTIKWDNRGH